jgi:hypothetical protein
LSWTIEFYLRKRVIRATWITKISSFTSHVHDTTLYAKSIRVCETSRTTAGTKVGNSILNRSTLIILTALCALIFVRAGAIFARVMAIFTKEKKFILMIIDIISEVRALIF